MPKKIAAKKVSKQEWARLIEQGIRANELKRRREERKTLASLRRYVSIPIIIGLSAIALYLILFDWTWMMKGILNAMISATLVATFLTYLAGRMGR